VDTKIAFEINPGTFIKIESRSLLAKKVINIVGNICDAGYTGNIIVQLQNTTNNDIIFQKHNKVAQVIFLPLVLIDELQRVEKCDQLKASFRATQGFGSSNQN
jgi:dUTPase